MNNKEKGDFGEIVARNHLENIGATILKTNYKTKLGEIDIIAKIKDYIVFIEVKARSSINYGYPSEAVGFRKQRKIINASKIFIQENNIKDIDIRFDIIEVYLKDRKIKHIEDAFFDFDKYIV